MEHVGSDDRLDSSIPALLVCAMGPFVFKRGLWMPPKLFDCVSDLLRGIGFDNDVGPSRGGGAGERLESLPTALLGAGLRGNAHPHSTVCIPNGMDRGVAGGRRPGGIRAGFGNDDRVCGQEAQRRCDLSLIHI